jgi:hypothetical protein
MATLELLVWSLLECWGGVGNESGAHKGVPGPVLCQRATSCMQ